MIYPKETQTNDTVATHFDNLDKYYRQLWGENLHHGYWITGNETVQQATENLIELVVQAGKINDHCKVLDIGCGYGAAARYIAHHIEAQVTAQTLSKSQWQYARTNDPESTNPRYILGDFLHNDQKDNSFDVILSIESSEHFAEKEKFFHEIHRLLKPGGRLVLTAWLAKENPSKNEVKYLLEPICSEGHIPSIGSEKEYREMMEKAGFLNIEFCDLTKSVKKTWAICAMRATKAFFSDKNLRHLLFSKDSPERAFAKALFRIWTAYTTGSMLYGMFTASE